MKKLTKSALQALEAEAEAMMAKKAAATVVTIGPPEPKAPTRWMLTRDVVHDNVLVSPDTGATRVVQKSSLNQPSHAAGLRRRVVTTTDDVFYRLSDETIPVDQLIPNGPKGTPRPAWQVCAEQFQCINGWIYDWPCAAIEREGEHPAIYAAMWAKIEGMLAATGLPFQLVALQRRHLTYFTDGSYNSQKIFDRLIPRPTHSAPMTPEGELAHQAYGKHWSCLDRDKKKPMPDIVHGGTPCLYFGPAWSVKVTLDGVSPLYGGCRMYVMDDGTFIGSDWCQRHDFTSYNKGGINLQMGSYDLAGWLLGPCLGNAKARGGLHFPSLDKSQKFVMRLMRDPETVEPTTTRLARRDRWRGWRAELERLVGSNEDTPDAVAALWQRTVERAVAAHTRMVQYHAGTIGVVDTLSVDDGWGWQSLVGFDVSYSTEGVGYSLAEFRKPIPPGIYVGATYRILHHNFDATTERIRALVVPPFSGGMMLWDQKADVLNTTYWQCGTAWLKHEPTVSDGALVLPQPKYIRELTLDRERTFNRFTCALNDLRTARGMLTGTMPAYVPPPTSVFADAVVHADIIAAQKIPPRLTALKQEWDGAQEDLKLANFLRAGAIGMAHAAGANFKLLNEATLGAQPNTVWDIQPSAPGSYARNMKQYAQRAVERTFKKRVPFLMQDSYANLRSGDAWYGGLVFTSAPITPEARGWCKHCMEYHRPVGAKAFAAQLAYDAVFGTTIAEDARRYKLTFECGASPRCCSTGGYTGPEPRRVVPAMEPVTVPTTPDGVPKVVSMTHEILPPPPVLDTHEFGPYDPDREAMEVAWKRQAEENASYNAATVVPILPGDVPYEEAMGMVAVTHDPLAAPTYLDEDYGPGEDYSDDDEDEDENDDNSDDGPPEELFQVVNYEAPTSEPEADDDSF